MLCLRKSGNTISRTIALIKKPNIVVLHGQAEDYLFSPHARKARLRKTAKFSQVYKGTSSEGKAIVVKTLSDELAKDPIEVALFRGECNWYNVHPNLLAPFEYILQDGRHYLIAEYLPGITVSTFVKKRVRYKNTRIQLAIQCGLQLLDAVEAMHQRGKIHSDIKPANVMLCADEKGHVSYKHPRVRLLDFGLSRLASTPPIQNPNRPKRPFVLIYSPPEQVMGFHDLCTYASDLHNIALLLYEIMVKEPVFTSKLSVNIMLLQSSYPLPAKKVIPQEFMRILQKAAHKHHFKRPPNHYKKSEVHRHVKEALAERYPTADAFRQDLLAFKTKWESRK